MNPLKNKQGKWRRIWIRRKTHPVLWSWKGHVALLRRPIGFTLNRTKYERYRTEANTTCPHLTPEERDAWAAHVAKTHPGFHGLAIPKKQTSDWVFVIVMMFIALLLLFLAVHVAKAEPTPEQRAFLNIVRRDFGLPQLVTPGGAFKFDASNNLDVNCISGCTAAAGFSDNGAFTAGTSTINIAGGWYSTSPTNCTSGSACAPQLTQDRKMFVQDFQGTSPWIDSVTTWGGGTLGAMANYGTSPGSVLVPGVNAFVTNFPATQPVSGTVAVSNFPGTQPVSGSVNVGNFPVVQPVSESTLDAALANPLPVVVKNTQSAVTVNNTGLQQIPVRVMSPTIVMAYVGGVPTPVQLVEGQSIMAQSVPVAIASDQTALNTNNLGKGTDGNVHQVATDGAGNQFFLPVGLPRQPCNPVRRTNCQP